MNHVTPILPHGKIGNQTRIEATAIASPFQFADMVSAAHDSGWVIEAGSRGMMFMGDLFEDPGRFAELGVENGLLGFFTWQPMTMLVDQHEPPGIYRNEYSLTEFELLLHELVEPYPKPGTEQVASGDP